MKGPQTSIPDWQRIAETRRSDVLIWHDSDDPITARHVRWGEAVKATPRSK